MNLKDRKEIREYEKSMADLVEKEKEYGKKGVIYCSASYVDQELASDEVEERLEHGEKIEDFVPKMYKIGYCMEVFEGDLD